MDCRSCPRCPASRTSSQPRFCRKMGGLPPSNRPMRLRTALPVALLTVLLAGCEQLGVETPAQEAARAVAEGKAIGSACRQVGRALEDCYRLNAKVPKAAVFDGWRDMDGYMRENKISEVAPQPLTSPSGSDRKTGASATTGAAHGTQDGPDTGKAEGQAEPTPAVSSGKTQPLSGKHAT